MKKCLVFIVCIGLLSPLRGGGSIRGLIINADGSPQPAACQKEKTMQRLKANLEFLASDELEGRATATRSEKIAAQFIAAELKKCGVQPFAGQGSYFQDVPLVAKVLTADSVLTISIGNDGREELALGRDFSVWGEFLPGVVNTLKKHESEKINYEKVCKTMDLVKAVALEIANLDHRLQFAGN